jgi:hypothetical protein
MVVSAKSPSRAHKLIDGIVIEGVLAINYTFTLTSQPATAVHFFPPLSFALWKQVRDAKHTELKLPDRTVFCGQQSTFRTNER